MTDQFEDDQFEDDSLKPTDESVDQSNYSRIRRIKTKNDQISSSRIRDLRSVVSAHGIVCDQLDVAIVELRKIILETSKTEHKAHRNNAFVSHLSRDISFITREISTLLSRINQEVEEVKKNESNHTKFIESVSVNLNSVLNILTNASQSASVLNRISSSGWNVEIQLNKKFLIPDLVRTITTAISQLSRTAKSSRIAVSSRSGGITDSINDTGSDF